jgi:putative SOS response-associated peptidase YedK
MCGRFVSASPPDEIARYFDAEQREDLIPASYNVAPTDDVYGILEKDGTRRLAGFHWGLVPLWAKDPKVGSRMINARADTVATKSAFKFAFAKRRCLIAADGFYEWKQLPARKKQAMYLHRADGEPLAFAGLWEVWRGANRDQDPLFSCTIITTDANDRVGEVHDRMPVILPPSAWPTWLDRDVDDVDELQALLVPAPPHLLAIRPVGPDVGNVKNNGPHLLDEVGEETLF